MAISRYALRERHLQVKFVTLQLFYWCHMLTLPWLVIMLVHGRQFWKWVLIPGALYAIEKILRYRKSRSHKHGETFIMEAILLPSQVRPMTSKSAPHRRSSLVKVIHLVIKKPRKFTYKPGDYIYINIPAVANFEWHPFSISSAPEHKGTPGRVVVSARRGSLCRDASHAKVKVSCAGKFPCLLLFLASLLVTCLSMGLLHEHVRCRTCERKSTYLTSFRR